MARGDERTEERRAEKNPAMGGDSSSPSVTVVDIVFSSSFLPFARTRNRRWLGTFVNWFDRI